MTVAVIDYGMGNIGSICNMLKYIGAEHVVTDKPVEIVECDKIILPGVGNFDMAMTNIEKLDLVDPLREFVIDRKMPILGICLGMQLMCRSSEEGAKPGLGYIDAHVRRFRPAPGSGLKVPHMGWSDATFQKQNALSDQLEKTARFYFVHSYAVTCSDQNDILSTTQYGDIFVSAFVRENVAGVQFHPEKSHKYGIQLFRNFIDRFCA